MHCFKFITVLLLLVYSINAHATLVFFKKGDIKKGTIVKDHIRFIILELEDGKQIRINYNDIFRILYTKINLCKIYIQKRDGKGIEAYKVAEDSESMTFRKVLYKPEEFKIKRSEILFIAEKNPSGLSGKPSQERIDLKWFPPYDKVTEYRIYIKKNENDVYKLAKKTGNKNCTLSGLKSNTGYFIIVKAVYADNYESSASNEIKVTTLNIVPCCPEDVSVKRIVSKDGKSLTALLRWKAAVDPDGEIKSYIIYQEKSDEYKKIGESRKSEYRVPNLDPKIIDYFYVRAKDDKGNLSNESNRVMTRKPWPYGVSFSPSYLLPMGAVFGKMYSAGYGGVFNFLKNHILLNELDFGLKAGFFNLRGKEEQKMAMIMPLLATVNYNIVITRALKIIPVFSAGCSLNIVKYNKVNETTAFSETKPAKRTIEPFFAFGINTRYEHQWGYFAQLGVEYAIIPEQNEMNSMMIFSLSVGMKL